MRALLAVLVCLWLLAPSAASMADQRDTRLDLLFARLKVTKNQLEALNAENEIWKIWTDADDPGLNILMEHGVAAMGAGDHKAALEAFNTIIEQKPDFAEGWNKRATLYYLMQRFDESVQDIARTLELEPRHFGALSGLGLINAALGRNKSAVSAFKQALKVNPHLAGANEHIEALERAMRGKDL